MKHIGEAHPSEKNIFTCPFCTQPFGRYIGYIDHLAEHKDRVIKCIECKKVFETLSGLRVHQKIHINQCPFCAENFSTKSDLVDHVDTDHKESPKGEERQCSLCEATYTTLEEVMNHIQQVHHRHECNICFMHFSAEHQLLAHRQEAHNLTNPGANVSLRNPSDQLPEPPAPTPHEVEKDPTAIGSLGDQMPRSEERVEPLEPETPKKDKEVKGRKSETEVFKVLCPACNRFLRDLKTRRLHIKTYHPKQLRSCHHCKRSYLDPWDYNEHMNNTHVWCEICRGYAKDQTTYDSHYKEKHESAKKSPLKVTQGESTPTKESEKEPEKEPTPEPPTGHVTALSQSLILSEVATTETDHEDCPFECKHCKKTFKKAPQRNMHINTVHRIHKCTDCDKHFLTEEGRHNYRADAHKHPRFHCRVKKCDVYTHNVKELHQHRRNKHWSKFPFRCNLCPYILEMRESFEKHLERMHGIPASKDDGTVIYKCTKCVKEFRSVNMFINHSKDHDENIYACRECRWCFAMLDRLHVHCKSTHDTMHHVCDTCGIDFPNNQDLYHHVTRDHVKLCHICHDNFVSDRQLQEHMDEAHTQTPVKSREQMIEDERAKEHEDKERHKQEKKRKKKKKKKDDDNNDDEDDDSTYHPSQDQGDEDDEWIPSKHALKRADKEGDY